MKLFEIESAPSKRKLYDALYVWFDQSPGLDKAVSTILSSPLIKDYQTITGVTDIYRTLTIKDGKLRMQASRSQEQVVAYTTDINVSHEFVKSFAHTSDYVVFKKKFNPDDLILDVTRFADAIGADDSDNEHEIWMKRTPYYTTYNDSEIVYDSRKDESLKKKPEKPKKQVATDPIADNDAFGAFLYARDHLKGRWPQAELLIMKNPNIAYYYARDVIKGRWPQAEKFIMKDLHSWKEYKKYFKIEE